eukprot:403336477
MQLDQLFQKFNQDNLEKQKLDKFVKIDADLQNLKNYYLNSNISCYLQQNFIDNLTNTQIQNEEFHRDVTLEPKLTSFQYNQIQATSQSTEIYNVKATPRNFCKPFYLNSDNDYIKFTDSGQMNWEYFGEQNAEKVYQKIKSKLLQSNIPINQSFSRFERQLKLYDHIQNQGLSNSEDLNFSQLPQRYQYLYEIDLSSSRNQIENDISVVQFDEALFQKDLVELRNKLKVQQDQNQSLRNYEAKFNAVKSLICKLCKNIACQKHILDLHNIPESICSSKFDQDMSIYEQVKEKLMRLELQKFLTSRDGDNRKQQCKSSECFYLTLDQTLQSCDQNYIDLKQFLRISLIHDFNPCKMFRYLQIFKQKTANFQQLDCCTKIGNSLLQNKDKLLAISSEIQNQPSIINLNLNHNLQQSSQIERQSQDGEDNEEMFKGCECEPGQCKESVNCSCLREGNFCDITTCKNCFDPKLQQDFKQSGQKFVDSLQYLRKFSQNSKEDTTLQQLCINTIDFFSIQNMKLGLSDSQIPNSGLGIFALAFIHKNQQIGIYTGEIIDQQNDNFQYDKRTFFKEFDAPSYIYDIKKDGFRDAINIGSLMRYMNHYDMKSKKVNVEVIIRKYQGASHIVVFRAKQDIQVGEELYINYGNDYFKKLEKK